MGGLRNISDNWGQRQKSWKYALIRRAVRAGIAIRTLPYPCRPDCRVSTDRVPGGRRDPGGPALEDIDAARRQQGGSLSVYNQSSGQAVPLRQVADVQLVWDIAKVYRRNGIRTVAVGAQLEPDVTAADRMAILLPWLEEQRAVWGSEVDIELGGESESQGMPIKRLPISCRSRVHHPAAACGAVQLAA